MHLTGEICGASIDARREAPDILIRIGDITCSPAEVDALAVPIADWTGTLRLGGFAFDSTALSALDSTALSALKQFAAAATLAAQAEESSTRT